MLRDFNCGEVKADLRRQRYLKPIFNRQMRQVMTDGFGRRFCRR